MTPASVVSLRPRAMAAEAKVPLVAVLGTGATTAAPGPVLAQSG